MAESLASFSGATCATSLQRCHLLKRCDHGLCGLGGWVWLDFGQERGSQWRLALQLYMEFLEMLAEAEQAET